MNDYYIKRKQQIYIYKSIQQNGQNQFFVTAWSLLSDYKGRITHRKTNRTVTTITNTLFQQCMYAILESERSYQRKYTVIKLYPYQTRKKGKRKGCAQVL